MDERRDKVLIIGANNVEVCQKFEELSLFRRRFSENGFCVYGKCRSRRKIASFVLSVGVCEGCFLFL